MSYNKDPEKINNSMRLLREFAFTGKMNYKKFKKFIAVMILTNLSSFLIVTIDGIVVGNFVGKTALNSVNLLYPFTLVIGALSSLFAQGIGVLLSQTYGSGRTDQKDKAIKTLVILSGIAVLVIGILQIPAATIMIENYGLDAETHTMIWQYATGIMISNFFSAISTICTYVLIASGQGTKLMWLSFLEGGTHLGFDLLFVGAMNMGVIGAGYGACTACAIRTIFASVVVIKTLKVFPVPKVKCGKEIKEALKSGIPAMASALVIAGQSYIMNYMIMEFWGMEGITAKSVAVFANSIAMVLINSSVQAVNPLIGISTGVQDWKSTKFLVRHSLMLCATLTFICTLLTVSFPEVLFSIYGLDTYTEAQMMAVELFGFQFVFRGINMLMRNDFIFLKMKSIATISTIFEMAVLLVPVAYILGQISGPTIFLSYTVCSAIIGIILLLIYHWKANEIENASYDYETLIISINQGNAIEASEKLTQFVEEIGGDPKIANYLGLVVEELGAYSKSNSKWAKEVNAKLFIKAYEDKVVAYYYDDGMPAILDDELQETEKTAADNYRLVKKICTGFKYQNVAGLNNFIMEFKLEPKQKKKTKAKKTQAKTTKKTQIKRA